MSFENESRNNPPFLNPISTPFQELHAEEVQSIISRPPAWIVRWGITTLFIIISLLIAGTCWISYPDVVTVPVYLSGDDAPRAVVSKTEGRLTSLTVKDGQTVLKGQILAYAESNADYEQIARLTNEIERISNDVSKQQWNAISKSMISPYSKLGEVQRDFEVFNRELVELKSFLDGGFYQQKRKLLIGDEADLRSMEQNIHEQLELQNRDLSLAAEEFKVQEKLYQNKVISSMEFSKEKTRLISREMPVKGYNSALIQNRAAQNAKRKELLELDNLSSLRKSTFQQALHTLASGLDAWRQRYVLTAPVSGSVSFSAPLQDQQHLPFGTELMVVVPAEKEIKAFVKIPQANIGKLARGQHVFVKLDGFPYREYGFLNGTLSKISTTPTKDSLFWGFVVMPAQLTTNLGRSLPYRTGLKGQADIVTTERTLSQRFLEMFINR